MKKDACRRPAPKVCAEYSNKDMTLFSYSQWGIETFSEN